MGFEDDSGFRKNRRNDRVSHELIILLSVDIHFCAPFPSSMSKLREETEKSDADKKKKLLVEQNAGYGYGGKFGLEKDRMDKSAMGNDYVGKVEKHESQTDHSKGFGGKFGVQSDRVDKSALGWDHVEKVEKHESQTDHSKGFGGKFGVQEDRKDKSALGWDHVEKVEKHESQVDHKTGFGGKFGVQSDRMDKSAVGFQDQGTAKIGTAYTKTKPDICGAKPSSLRARFENFSQVSDEDSVNRAAEQKKLREEKDRMDRERAAKDEKAVNSQEDRPAQQRKGAIQTGREGGIGTAINRFNQPKEEQEPATTPKKQPIEIPRGAPLIVENNPLPSQNIIPDVVQQVERQASVEKRPVEVEEEQQETHFEPEPVKVMEQKVHVEEKKVEVQREEVVERSSMGNVIVEEEVTMPTTPTMATSSNPVQHYEDVAEQSVVAEEKEAQPSSGQFQSLPPSEDLAEYIEDTGVRATALYDYQAAAEDEISFDPDDLITHIEMVSGLGNWRSRIINNCDSCLLADR